MNKVFLVISTTAKLLTFQRVKIDLKSQGKAFLGFGLFCTWLAGVGRYWDDAGASVFQHLGLGSVAYVFAMALLIFIVAIPLKPANWSYYGVLIFVSLTSPPALLYAIPVERIFEFEIASKLNFYFLAIIAAWRVALLILFLRRAAKLSAGEIIVTAFLPLTGIVVTLASLNLERAVFEIMGGIREATTNDAAFAMLTFITVISVVLLPILMVIYGALALQHWQRGKQA